MIQKIKKLFWDKREKLTLKDIKVEDTFDSSGTKLIKRKYLVPVGGRGASDLASDIIKKLFWEYSEEYERVLGEVVQENRDRAINSILEDKEFNPMRIDEHPDYKGTKGVY